MPKSKICLPDVNVWIAFAWAGHLDHDFAKSWFASLDRGEAAFCRITQMGFLRLITNSRVMGNEALSQRNAWAIYEDLLRDKRISFTSESAEVEPVWKRYTQAWFTGTNVWTDAYLVAIAAVQGMQLVSFDRGLARIKELEPLILGQQ
jgi:toxin-antitoxin system PIN domain toxin